MKYNLVIYDGTKNSEPLISILNNVSCLIILNQINNKDSVFQSVYEILDIHINIYTDMIENVIR